MIKSLISKLGNELFLVILTLNLCAISYSYAQNIRFVSFKATNEYKDSTYNLDQPIRLNSQETHILVKFSDDLDSSRALYSYRLLNLDERWHENGQCQYINYVNLLGGNYQLQVKNRHYPAKVAILKFQLEEAFWQKPWFIPMMLAYGMLIGGIILYFFRVYKLRSVIRLQHIRNEIAADLHDDVGSTLSNISFLGEMAKMKFEKKPEEALHLLERIVEDSKEMVQTMRGMVWTINPDNDNAYDFIDKVRAFATEMLQNREIILNFKNEIPQNQLLTIEQQRNLFLIFKELIHNIAKHSAATQVTIHLKKHDGWLWAKVTDNGRGFDTNQVADGNGLRNLQHRIAQLEGKIDVTSMIGSGTTTKLMIPF